MFRSLFSSQTPNYIGTHGVALKMLEPKSVFGLFRLFPTAPNYQLSGMPVAPRSSSALCGFFRQSPHYRLPGPDPIVESGNAGSRQR